MSNQSFEPSSDQGQLPASQTKQNQSDMTPVTGNRAKTSALSSSWEPLGCVRDYLTEQMRHDHQW